MDAPNLQIKRIYEPPAPSDGKRILVDRLWPRGISKDQADLYEWMKEIAPSPELRKWFNHQPERFAEFRRQYELELANDPTRQALLAELTTLTRQGPVTLLYAAKDPDYNQAVIIKAQLEKGT